MPKRNRTIAREIALQTLYQQDLAGNNSRKMWLYRDWEIRAILEQTTDNHKVRDYARMLILGTLKNIRELDERISEVTDNWKLERIAAVDRAALRQGLYELLEVAEVPPKVVINETVELAKTFSTAKSGAFVNGVLDKLYQNLLATSES